VIVNEMSDEFTKVDGSAVGDVSDRDGVNDTAFSYIIVSFDQIWRASVSITNEAADIASYPKSVVAPSQKYTGCESIRQQISSVRVTGPLTVMWCLPMTSQFSLYRGTPVQDRGGSRNYWRVSLLQLQYRVA